MALFSMHDAPRANHTANIANYRQTPIIGPFIERDLSAARFLDFPGAHTCPKCFTYSVQLELCWRIGQAALRNIIYYSIQVKISKRVILSTGLPVYGNIFFSYPSVYPSWPKQNKTMEMRAESMWTDTYPYYIQVIPIPNPVIENSNQDGVLYQSGTKLMIGPFLFTNTAA